MRSLLAALVVATALSACGGVSARPQRATSPSAPPGPDVAAFERAPGVRTWSALHAGLLRGPIAVDTESRLVETLAARDVPRNVFAAAAVDLATLDWGGAMQWSARTNLAARGSRNDRAVARTSALVWMLLELRASYAGDPVDLTRTDLRAGAPPDGVPMNLAHVDFSAARLSAMRWHRVVLTDALFDGTLVDGSLTCTACTFGTLHFAGTVTLAGGSWH